MPEKKYPIYDKDDSREVKRAKRQAYVDSETKKAKEKIKRLKAERAAKEKAAKEKKVPASHDSNVPRKIKQKNGG